MNTSPLCAVPRSLRGRGRVAQPVEEQRELARRGVAPVQPNNQGMLPILDRCRIRALTTAQRVERRDFLRLAVDGAGHLGVRLQLYSIRIGPSAYIYGYGYLGYIYCIYMIRQFSVYGTENKKNYTLWDAQDD